MLRIRPKFIVILITLIGALSVQNAPSVDDGRWVSSRISRKLVFHVESLTSLFHSRDFVVWKKVNGQWKVFRDIASICH